MRVPLKTATLLTTSFFAIFILQLCNTNCNASYSQNVMVEVPAGEQPFFIDSASMHTLADAVLQSLGYLKRMPAQRKFYLAGRSYDKEWLQESLEYFLVLLEKARTPDELHQQLKKNFHVYQVLNSTGDEEVLVTGYYEPIVKGSLQKRGPYQYPLYGPPSDLVRVNGSDDQVTVGRYVNGRLVPYWTRREIDETGVLAGNELVYVTDPVDA